MNAKRSIKKSESNAAKGSRVRSVSANKRTRSERKLASGRKTRG
jgi:hypothetical protein